VRNPKEYIRYSSRNAERYVSMAIAATTASFLKGMAAFLGLVHHLVVNTIHVNVGY